MNRRARLEINLGSICENYRSIVRYLPDERFICAMVKDEAYGHGLVPVALALETVGCQRFGVSLVEEGISLRQAGVQSQILMFGDFDKDAVSEMGAWKITPIASSWRNLEDLASATPNPIHIKFDTGMSRMGFFDSEAEAVQTWLSGHPQFRVEGVLTHLSHGELTDGAITARQLCQLRQIEKFFPNAQIHSLNSGGILNRILQVSQKVAPSVLKERAWGLRPGLMLYGSSPVSGELPFVLKTALSLKVKPALIRRLKKGKGVSYNSSWVAPYDATIAVLPIGYGDGVGRILSNKIHGYLEGKKVPQVGTICMDFLMMDITQVAENQSLDDLMDKDVLLLGEDGAGHQIPAEEVALLAATVPWEVFTNLKKRLPRIYLK